MTSAKDQYTGKTGGKDQPGQMSYDDTIKYLKGLGMSDEAAQKYITDNGIHEWSNEELQNNANAHPGSNGFLGDIGKPGKQQQGALGDQASAKATWEDINGRQPTPDELRQDPSLLHQYSGGQELDLQHSRDALWDPSTSGLSSAYNNFNVDQTGRQGATDALSQYKSLIANGGHDAAGDADMARRMGEAEQRARASREAGVQNAQERGMYGGGSGLMVDLQSASDLSRDAHAGGLEAAALAQARRDSATQNMGTLGTSLYGQDANVENAKAAGQDKFSTTIGNWEQTHGQNASDLWGQQDTNNWSQGHQDRNADVSNYNSTVQANYGIPQQVFNNEKDVVAGKTGQYNNSSNVHMGVAQNPGGTLPTIGNTIQNAATAYQTFSGGDKKKVAG